MTRWYRHPRFWLLLTLAVVIALWLRAAQPDTGQSPLSTPVNAEATPLSTPPPESAAPFPPSAWSNGWAVLLWVALGGLLALSIALAILRLYRGAA